MEMSLNQKLTIMIWAWAMVVAGIMSGMVADNALGGDTASGMPVLHDGARVIDDVGPIMYVDHVKRQIIIKEIPHIVGQFVVNEKVYTTRLADADGNVADLDCFESGQWVMVQGYRVAKSKIYLKAVRAVNGAIQKEQRTVERLLKSIE
jgi:hypothetical protein